jgi:signal transduction histidine kinase
VSGSGAGRAADVPPAAASVERLWLAALQRLVAGVGHEIRNALNGVAVNLEVVRSRSEREGVAATALAQYARTASEQLEAVIAIADALVALNRAPKQSIAIGRLADQLLALIRPPLAANGGSVRLVVEGEGTTSVAADVARVVLAGALEAAAVTAMDERAELLCVVRPGAGVDVEISVGSRALAIDAEVKRIAKESDVGMKERNGITLSFPK